ncbi:MAG: serine/threonine protein kinase, partial [Myxococcota bacterium]
AAPRFHGDLKPSNVIIRPDGTVCLVDVGAGVTALGGSLSGSLDSRFRDPMGRAGPPADVYAVGRLAAELFGAPEASSEPAAAPGKAHDRRVRRLVSRLQLDGIAAADAATLRTLIARCMGSSSSSRPSAGQAAGILHEIADRAMGPGLASFCRTRLATWVTEPPLQPDASVRAITVARWTEHLDDADPSTITEEAPSITEHLSADFEATTVRIPVVHRSGDEELTIRLPLPGRSARVLIGLTGLFAGFAVMTCMGSTLVAALVGAWEAGLLG